jgi:O-antigen biosynthesis protein WbqP
MSPLKRTLDVTAALAGLIILTPVLIVVAILVGITSKGFVLFRQVRVGRQEQTFVCNKFRTMHEGTTQRGTHEINSSALTSAGAFLRALKLDELPQLWNVLWGEMSLVGPRPCLPNQQELIAERRAREVFSVSPGITGLAQVQGVDISKPKQLAEIDQTYIRTRSIGMDLKLIFRTLFRI